LQAGREKKLRYFSYFGGVGGVCAGAQDAGLEVVGTVEIDPAIAAIHKANFPYADCRVANVLDVDPSTLPDFDFFWSSNPCPNFSTAKQNGGETELDIALAQSVANVIQYKRPRYFALENVRGYAKSKSLGIITDELDRQGYSFNVLILDAANYGVPQNRIRLILRATLDSNLRDLPPTHSKGGGLFTKPWVSWYEAIADLLPSCKKTHLTEKQAIAFEKYKSQPCMVAGMANSYGSSITTVGLDAPSNTVTASCSKQLRRAVLVEGKTSGDRLHTVRNSDCPSITVLSNQSGGGRTPKVIIERVGYGQRPPQVREDGPAWTIRASVGDDGKGSHRSPITVADGLDVRAIDYRCLARFQSFPKWFVWPGPKGKCMRGIGNACPSLFAQRIIESLVNQKQ
jgi:DNA (cytosine-5)-methyltransferase 1